MYFQNDDSEYEAGGIVGWQHRAQAVLEDNLAPNQPVDTRAGLHQQYIGAMRDREEVRAHIRAQWNAVNERMMADREARMEQIGRVREVLAPHVRTIGQMYQPMLVEGGDRGDQQG